MKRFYTTIFTSLITLCIYSQTTHTVNAGNFYYSPSSLTIDVGDNNRLSKPNTSRIAYTAVIDVMTMGVAQLKPEAQEHLYNIVDSQRSLRVK